MLAARPLKLQSSGKVILNHIYRSAVTEGAATFNPEDREQHGQPLLDLEQTYTGAHSNAGRVSAP